MTSGPEYPWVAPTDRSFERRPPGQTEADILHDLDTDFAASGPVDYRLRQVVLVATAGAPPGEQIVRSAGALGLDIRTTALAAIGEVPAPDLLWVTLAIDPGAAALDELAQRQDGDRLPLVLDVSGAAIDAVWARFGDSDGVSILVQPSDAECLAAMGQALQLRSGRLNSPMVEERSRQLEQLRDEVQRIQRVLVRLGADESSRVGASDGTRLPESPFIDDHVRSPMRSYGAGPAVVAGRHDLAPIGPRDIRRIIRQRRMREEFFGAELFADPAWDMLLDLYAARIERHRVSVSSLCIAAAVPATTALRWIKTLTESGVFERAADPHDGRRIFVILSEATAAALGRYFTALGDEPMVI